MSVTRDEQQAGHGSRAEPGEGLPAAAAPEYHLAAPHEEFPPEVTAFVRFLEFPEGADTPPCAVCGRHGDTTEHDEDEEEDKGGPYWTMAVRFTAGRTEDDEGRPLFELQMSKPLPALTPVCSDHPTVPVDVVHREVLLSASYLADLWVNQGASGDVEVFPWDAGGALDDLMVRVAKALTGDEDTCPAAVRMTLGEPARGAGDLHAVVLATLRMLQRVDCPDCEGTGGEADRPSCVGLCRGDGWVRRVDLAVAPSPPEGLPRQEHQNRGPVNPAPAGNAGAYREALAVWLEVCRRPKAFGLSEAEGQELERGVRNVVGDLGRPWVRVSTLGAMRAVVGEQRWTIRGFSFARSGADLIGRHRDDPPYAGPMPHWGGDDEPFVAEVRALPDLTDAWVPSYISDAEISRAVDRAREGRRQEATQLDTAREELTSDPWAQGELARLRERRGEEGS